MSCSSVLRASPGKYPRRAHIQKSLERELLRKVEICKCSCSILYPRFQFNLFSVFECCTELRVEIHLYPSQCLTGKNTDRLAVKKKRSSNTELGAVWHVISVFVHSSCGFIHSALFPPISRVWSFSIPRREQEQEVSKLWIFKLSWVLCIAKATIFYLNNNGPSCKKFRNIFYFQIAAKAKLKIKISNESLITL